MEQKVTEQVFNIELADEQIFLNENLLDDTQSEKVPSNFDSHQDLNVDSKHSDIDSVEPHAKPHSNSYSQSHSEAIDHAESVTPTIEQLLEDEKHLPAQSNAGTYYRSRLFSAHPGHNPLMSAAQPILSLLPRLVDSPSWPDELTLKEYLSHEVKAFETQARANDISDEIIALARLILLSTIDDKIISHARSKQCDWEASTLQKYYLNESNSSEHFFTILKRASDYPMAHLELLELMYHCLACGYRGLYRHQVNGSEQLTRIREQLFSLVSEKRRSHNKGFFNESLEKLNTADATPPRSISRYSIALTLLLSIFTAGIYYTLDLSTAPILQHLSSINHQMMHSTVITNAR